MKLFLHSLALTCCLFVVQALLPSNREPNEHVINKRQANRIEISFTEVDYEADEDTGFITVGLQVLGVIREPLTIQLIPHNISFVNRSRSEFNLSPEFINIIPQENPRRPVTAISGVDFNTSVVQFVLTTSTSTQRLISRRVPIIPDGIYEANQIFALQLVVIGGLQVESLRDMTLLEIIDNDEVILIWQFPSYTFSESLLQRVFLIKADGTSTELVLDVFIQAVQPTTANVALYDADYTFGVVRTGLNETIRPDEQSKEIRFIIRQDGIFEGIEQFSLRVSNDRNGAPFTSRINGTLRDTALVSIIDEIQIGFVQTFINVSEDQRMVKLCVAITSRDRVDKIERAVTLGILTINGSAGGEDYTEINDVGGQPLVIDSKPVNGSHCFSINITDDNIVEDGEEFNVTLHLAIDDPALLRSVTLDPSVATIRIIDNDDGIMPIIVNDTVIGDPLLTVPINVINLESEGFKSNLSLCFELHGESDRYFNLVSDQCVSVNSHYAGVSIFNIIDEIAVNAVDETGACRNIMVSLKPDECAASLDGFDIDKMTTVDGISIRKYSNRVRVSVPNCEDMQLVMWIFCLNQTLQGFDKDTLVSTEARMMKFVIARGFNLQETSHGILGQFWNIPLTIQRYNGSLSNGDNAQRFYNVTVISPTSPPRSFPGFLWSVAWEYSTTGERKPCLYSGTKNAGPTSEITELTDSVIEGSYLDYIADEPYSTDFKYNQFIGTCQI